MERLERAVAELVRAEGAPGGPAAAPRWRAGLELGSMGGRAVSALVGALAHADAAVRIAAQHALRDIGPAAAAALPALTANLSHADPLVRRSALGALAALGPAGAEAAPALLAAAAGDEDLDVRGGAVWALHQFIEEAWARHPPVLEGLARALRDPECMVRLNAASALGSLGPAALPVLPALSEVLDHPDQRTRIYAARAIGRLGPKAAPVAPRLRRALATLADDEHARRQIAGVVERLTGRRPPMPPAAPPPVETRPWPALQRRDFLLLCQPLLTQRRTIDQDVLLRAFLDARVCNGFCFWPDHTWFNIPTPTPDQLRRWGMAAMWYFFTEDIYNPKQQRDWGFRTLEEYNAAMVDQILRTGQSLGPECCLWSVGHEHFDAGHYWGVHRHGVHRPPAYRTKRGGYAFYQRWITTGLHRQHWHNQYANDRPAKFYRGWDTGAPATWEFLDQRRIDTTGVTMISGGVCPALAHAAFAILPRIGWYWWECQVDGASLIVGAAYVRGAARQYGRKWLVDASPWSPLDGAMRFDTGGNNIKGVSDGQQRRTWVYGYLAGADGVFEEASNLTHFFVPGADAEPRELRLTSTGRMAREVADFCFNRCPDRGEAYRPVALLLEHEHGYEPRPHTNFRGQGPWYTLSRGPGEWEIERFWQAVCPEHSAFPPEASLPPDAPKEHREPLCLHATALGDVFDVLTDRAPPDVLRRYPRAMTLGGVRLGPTFRRRLERYVRGGGELLVNAAHLSEPGLRAWGAVLGVAAPANITGQLKGEPFSMMAVEPRGAEVLRRDDMGRPVALRHTVGAGAVVLVTAMHGLLGRPIDEQSAFLPGLLDLLREWIAPVYPLRVETRRGEPPHHMLNRLGGGGWLVTIGNHARQHWVGRVRLLGSRAAAVRELWAVQAVSREVHANDAVAFEAEVPPYAFRVYEVR